MDVQLPLTEQQQKTLDYIADVFRRMKYPPTIAEIQADVGFKNPGHVFRLLFYLEKKGYITRQKGAHRGVRLTPMAEKIYFQSDVGGPPHEAAA